MPPNFSFSAFEEITVSSSAVTLTAATYGTLNQAMLTVAGANIRYTVDGTTPTTDIGHILYDKDVLYLEGADELAGFQAIRDDSTDAELSCSYGVRVS